VSSRIQFILLLSFLDCLPEDRAQHWWRDSTAVANKAWWLAEEEKWIL